MDPEKLNRIVLFGEDLGFDVRTQRADYATFERQTHDYNVEVIYDADRSKYGKPVAYVSTSSMNEDNLEVWREFTAWIQKAIVLADKLMGTKVNGA
jgi:hypothetical protein